MNDQDTQPEDCVMCHCSGTKRNNIHKLFNQGMDMAAISRWTGALSGCGGCEWDIAAFLKELAEQRNDGSITLLK
jgi:bacterioferritin-associated ferredoxin